MSEPKARHELTHAVVLIRAGLSSPWPEELSYLKDKFDDKPVSIYGLPSSNLFDFALVGGLSDDLVDSLIVKAKAPGTYENRFDGIMMFEAFRYVYHGKTVDETDPRVGDVLKRTEAQLSEDALHGMFFFSDDLADPARRRQTREDLESVLDNVGASMDYCLSSIGPPRDLRAHYPAGGRNDFLFRQMSRCNSWLRFSILHDLNLGPREALSRIHQFQYQFREMRVNQVTTVTCPAIVHRVRKEIVSAEQLCRDSLRVRFPKSSKPMLWFGFKQGRKDTPERIPPDIALPLGNFIVSAKARIGKTNAALAILEAFARWQSNTDGELAEAPGYKKFDILYINLKSRDGSKSENQHVGERNEAVLIRAFTEKTGLPQCHYVRPQDIEHFLRGRDQRASAIAYTEPDGKTAWADLIARIDGLGFRAGRGLLVVVDEAFSPDWDVRQRADIHLLYPLIYNKLGSHAVRAVLIGQEIRAIKEAHPELGWVFEKSTLVVGSQSEIEEKEVLREVLLARCDAKEVSYAEWLDCAYPQRLNTVAGGEEKPYTVGPVIVRPSLFGLSVCHPIPCHVRPEKLELETAPSDLVWWEPK